MGSRPGWLLGHPFAALSASTVVAGRHDGVRQSGRGASASSIATVVPRSSSGCAARPTWPGAAAGRLRADVSTGAARSTGRLKADEADPTEDVERDSSARQRRLGHWVPLLAGDSYPERSRRAGAHSPCWYREASIGAKQGEGRVQRATDTCGGSVRPAVEGAPTSQAGLVRTGEDGVDLNPCSASSTARARVRPSIPVVAGGRWRVAYGVPAGGAGLPGSSRRPVRRPRRKAPASRRTERHRVTEPGMAANQRGH